MKPETSSSPANDHATAANTSFHHAYDQVRARASQELPVLVVLGDDLILVHGGARSVVPYVPPLFHRIKAVAHAPVAVVALHHRSGSEALDETPSEALRGLVSSVRALREQLKDARESAPERATIANLASILSRTIPFVEDSLTAGRVDVDELRAFASAVGPMLLQATQDATRIQLRGLHEAARQVFGVLAAIDRERLEVVVAGAHQARARNLAMQYFQKRFGEAPAEERRVSYAENAESVDDALEQVGTRRLDRVIARALFGDEKRLQRDVLGDAAREQLASFDIEAR